MSLQSPVHISYIYTHMFILTKIVSQLSVADLLSFLSKMQCMLGNFITCDIRCHDKDSIFTFDGLPLTICEATLSHIMNVSKCFLQKATHNKSHSMIKVCVRAKTSSNNCSMIVRTSGWALSTSSNSTTALGHSFNSLVKWPPSSCPT